MDLIQVVFGYEQAAPLKSKVVRKVPSEFKHIESIKGYI